MARDGKYVYSERSCRHVSIRFRLCLGRNTSVISTHYNPTMQIEILTKQEYSKHEKIQKLHWASSHGCCKHSALLASQRDTKREERVLFMSLNERLWEWKIPVNSAFRTVLIMQMNMLVSYCCVPRYWSLCMNIYCICVQLDHFFRWITKNFPYRTAELPKRWKVSHAWCCEASFGFNINSRMRSVLGNFACSSLICSQVTAVRLICIFFLCVRTFHLRQIVSSRTSAETEDYIESSNWKMMVYQTFLCCFLVGL